MSWYIVCRLISADRTVGVTGFRTEFGVVAEDID